MSWPNSMARVAGLLLCMGLSLAGGTLAAPLNTTGPQCANFTASVTGLLGAINTPVSDQFCAFLLDSTACTKLAMLETSLVGPPDEVPPCDPNGQVPAEGALLPFADLRPLPAYLSNFTELAAAEGPTWAWLYRNMLNLRSWAHCTAAGRNDLPLLVPEGWELYKIINNTDPNTGREVPFVALLLEPSAGALAIIVRGTGFGFEWQLDFAWNQTTLPVLGDVPVHWGVAQIFQEVWPGVQAALQELVVDSGAVDTIYLTGHSLGSAVGTMLAYAGQSLLEEQMGAGAPVISAALAAPLNVASPQFAELFNARVNARRITFEYDAIPQVPCAPAFPACTPSENLLSGQFTLVPTDQPGNPESWPYEHIGGEVTIRTLDMPQDTESWAALSSLEVCWIWSYFSATHTCAYTCFLSQFAAGEAADLTSCWLAERPAGAAGTTCADWPTNYPGMAAAA